MDHEAKDPQLLPVIKFMILLNLLCLSSSFKTYHNVKNRWQAIAEARLESCAKIDTSPESRYDAIGLMLYRICQSVYKETTQNPDNSVKMIYGNRIAKMKIELSNTTMLSLAGTQIAARYQYYLDVLTTVLIQGHRPSMPLVSKYPATDFWSKPLPVEVTATQCPLENDEHAEKNPDLNTDNGDQWVILDCQNG